MQAYIFAMPHLKEPELHHLGAVILLAGLFGAALIIGALASFAFM